MKTRIALSFALVAGLALGQAQPKPKSQKELEAIQAIFNAQDPDARISAADNLLSEFRRHRVQGDCPPGSRRIRAAEERLREDGRLRRAYPRSRPEELSRHVDVGATVIAQRTREFDLDKEEKLGRAEKYAKSAIELVKGCRQAAPRHPGCGLGSGKAELLAQGYEALGLAAMVRKKYDDAATQFQSAVTRLARTGNHGPARRRLTTWRRSPIRRSRHSTN